MWLDDPLSSLQATLAHATATIPHYREHPAYAAPLESLADLARLPFIHPDEYAAAPERYAVAGAFPEMVSFSSSTTGALGRPRWHLQREFDAHAAALRAALPPADDAGATLVIHPYDQGAIQRPSGDRRTVYVPFLLPWHHEMILRLLQEGWRTPAGLVRIDHIDAFSPALRIYSEWLRQRGVDPGGLGVRALTGYGSLQPFTWRRRLTREWRADYQDIYGLSEVKQSEANTCPICGAYHFLRPIVAEVVDPDTRAPIREGFGVLVLSELHPFAELQVLLRYWTDDLVEIAPPCMIADLGFRFRGRRPAALRALGPAGPTYLAPLQVAEILAEFPDVALAAVPWAAWAQDVGAPRFALRADGPRLIVDVELRYAPALFPARAAALADELRAHLLRAVTGLAAAIDAGAADLSIETCPSGSLRDPAKV